MNFYSLITSNYEIVPLLAYSTKDGYSSFHKKWVFFYDENKHKPLSNEKATLNNKTNMWAHNLLYYAGITLDGELKCFVDNYLEFDLTCNFDKNKNYKEFININKIKKYLRTELQEQPQNYKYLERFLVETDMKGEFEHLSRSTVTGLWF